MMRRAWCLLTVASAVAVACNTLSGIDSLSVEDVSTDAAVVDATPPAITEAGPARTTGGDASPVEDAGFDADADADASLPPNVGIYAGHRYEVVVAPSISWSSAREASTGKGGHLATITSENEKSFVAALVTRTGAADSGYGPWLGGSKPQVNLDAEAGPADPAANWSWVTGETWSYTSWGDGQPDNDDNDENCLGGLGDSTAGLWNDYRNGGDGQVSSYVIEYEHL